MFGAILFAFNYFLAVRVHLTLHDEPHTYALALLVLPALALCIWPLFGWLGEIQDYKDFFTWIVLGGGLSAWALPFLRNKVRRAVKAIPPVSTALAIIVALAGALGKLALPETLDVSTERFLLGNPSARHVFSFAVLVIFFSALVNVIVASAWTWLRVALAAVFPSMRATSQTKPD